MGGSHTSSTEPHKQPVNFSSDAPTLQGDSHAPTQIYHTQFTTLSARFGSECGLSNSPTRISLLVHTSVPKPPERHVDFGSDAPTLQGDSHAPTQIYHTQFTTLSARFGSECGLGNSPTRISLLVHTSVPKPPERHVDFGSDAPTLQGDSHAPTQIYHTQFTTLSARFGSECGLGNSPTRISLLVHTSVPKPPERHVDFGSDAPTLQGDSHAPTQIYHTQFTTLSARFGSECGLGNSPTRISLLVHTSVPKPPERHVDFGSDAPTLQGDSHAPTQIYHTQFTTLSARFGSECGLGNSPTRISLLVHTSVPKPPERHVDFGSDAPTLQGDSHAPTQIYHTQFTTLSARFGSECGLGNSPTRISLLIHTSVPKPPERHVDFGSDAPTLQGDSHAPTQIYHTQFTTLSARFGSECGLGNLPTRISLLIHTSVPKPPERHVDFGSDAPTLQGDSHAPTQIYHTQFTTLSARFGSECGLGNLPTRISLLIHTSVPKPPERHVDFGSDAPTLQGDSHAPTQIYHTQFTTLSARFGSECGLGNLPTRISLLIHTSVPKPPERHVDFGSDAPTLQGDSHAPTQIYHTQFTTLSARFGSECGLGNSPTRISLLIHTSVPKPPERHVDFGSDAPTLQGDSHAPTQIYHAQFTTLSARFGSECGLGNLPTRISLLIHTSVPKPPERHVDFGSDAPALQGDSHAPTQIYHTQFTTLSARFGSECGLGNSPTRISLLVHTSVPKPPERHVDFGSDAPTLQGDSHAPTQIYHTQFTTLSARFGRECGLGNLPTRISLLVHTSVPKPPERHVDFGSDAPTLQGDSHAPTQIYHTQFATLSARFGRECGLGNSPTRISLLIHTSVPKPPERHVDFGSDAPALQGDSHAPTQIYHTQFTTLSARFGSECGLGNLPTRISLLVHTSVPKPPERHVDFGSDAPALQGDSHAPTQIYHTQFATLSARFGRECGLGNSPTRISLLIHTSVPKPPERHVDFGRAGSADAQARVHVLPPRFTSLRGPFGSESAHRCYHSKQPPPPPPASKIPLHGNHHRRSA